MHNVATSMRNTWTGAAVALMAAAVTLAACGGHGGDDKKKDAKAGGSASAQTVTVQIATLQNLSRTVTASGTVSAWEEVPVGAETGGLTATAVHVDEGSYVRQGQPLLIVRPRN